jgi:hypothetical protein
VRAGRRRDDGVRVPPRLRAGVDERQHPTRRTAEDLQPLLDQVDDQKPEQLGALVVEHGIATNGQVLEALEQQVRLRFQRACRAPDTTYEFLEGPPRPTDGRIKIAPIELTR